MVAQPTDRLDTDGAPRTPPDREAVQAAFPELEILEMIGQGGMGTVFKAWQPKLDRYVALKILSAHFTGAPVFTDRFAREGKLLARLSHPNIVTVYDYGQAGEFYYLMLEYVDGVNLRQAMREQRFTPEQALAIVPKICDALQYAHDEGVLHRDIKPENILLDTRGRIKITDFGIGKLTEQNDPPAEARNVGERHPALTGEGQILGTPNYMAPEQRDTPNSVDHRADIYSLGVVFYELLTGELPKDRFLLPSEKSNVSGRVDEIVLKALERERDKRYQTAEELKTQVETLTAVVNEMKIAPKHWMEWFGYSKSPRHHLVWAFVCLGIAVLANLLLIVIQWVSGLYDVKWPAFAMICSALPAIIMLFQWLNAKRKERLEKEGFTVVMPDGNAAMGGGALSFFVMAIVFVGIGMYFTIPARLSLIPFEKQRDLARTDYELFREICEKNDEIALQIKATGQFNDPKKLVFLAKVKVDADILDKKKTEAEGARKEYEEKRSRISKDAFVGGAVFGWGGVFFVLIAIRMAYYHLWWLRDRSDKRGLFSSSLVLCAGIPVFIAATASAVFLTMMVRAM